MANFTPGPWTADHRFDRIEDGASDWVADTGERNLDLIAAAPDLYGAITDLMTFVSLEMAHRRFSGDMHALGRWLSAAAQALNKADGK